MMGTWEGRKTRTCIVVAARLTLYISRRVSAIPASSQASWARMLSRSSSSSETAVIAAGLRNLSSASSSQPPTSPLLLQQQDYNLAAAGRWGQGSHCG